jgi:transcriptional regulator with XRE-family HTH domain
MNTSRGRRGHLNRWALAALFAAERALAEAEGGKPRTKADFAKEAEITPTQLNHLLSGSRHGQDPEQRARLAGALGVDPRAIECLCDHPSNHGGDL